MSIADTNQASEELKQKLRDTKTFNYNVYFGVDGGDYAISFDEAIDEIVSLIRTEKLKLLEQVEAAIDDGKRSHSMAVIRAALTKLEAEL